MKKTVKLTCNITGKSLQASKDYYSKKVQKIGSEKLLHETYICREAKTLLKKGYSIEYIRETLNANNSFTSRLTDEQAQELVNNNSLRLNTFNQIKTNVIKTDSDVLQFIKNITNGT